MEDAHQVAGQLVYSNWHVLARIRMTDGIEGTGYIVQLRGDLMRTIAVGPGGLLL